MSENDLVKYVTYVPNRGIARVKAGRVELYSTQNDVTLYAAVDTYLVDATWISRMTWNNDTDAEQSCVVEYETGLNITEGGKITNGYSVGAAFDGFSISFEQQQKVFTTTETKEAKTISIPVTVPARSYVTFYQRRYKFKNSMFFILDTGNQLYNIGSWGSYDLSRLDCILEIMSEDYVILSSDLDGSAAGTIDVKGLVEAVPSVGLTWKREDCPEECQTRLEDLGV